MQVANFSDQPIYLSSDLPVAEYHPISGVNSSAIPIEVEPESKPSSHPSCSSIGLTSKAGDKGRLICDQQNLEGLSEGQKEQFVSLVREYADIFAMNSCELGKSNLLEHAINKVTQMNQYHLTLLGMCEVRWNSHGETRLQTGEVLLYSGKDSDDDRHEAGVSLLLSKHAAKSLIEWEPVSDRIITARFESRFLNVSVVMCYAPTNNAEEDDKDSFYAEVPGRDMLILMGDMNAKVGSSNTDREREMGRHGLGDMNENGEMLADFCAVNNLVIGGTLFPHRRHHKATWISPDHQTENQIDHVIIRHHCRT